MSDKHFSRTSRTPPSYISNTTTIIATTTITNITIITTTTTFLISCPIVFLHFPLITILTSQVNISLLLFHCLQFILPSLCLPPSLFFLSFVLFILSSHRPRSSYLSPHFSSSYLFLQLALPPSNLHIPPLILSYLFTSHIIRLSHFHFLHILFIPRTISLLSLFYCLFVISFRLTLALLTHRSFLHIHLSLTAHPYLQTHSPYPLLICCLRPSTI